MKENKKRESIILALTALVFLLGSVAATRLFFRLDFTKDRSFSISKVSRNLFKEIPEQVRITYYISGKLSSSRPEPQRVEDMLREYAAVSRGKIRVEVVDPDKSGDSATIQEWGIYSQPYEVMDKNQYSVANVYSGIAVEYLDRREILPFAFQIETLEYDLTRTIRSVVSQKDRVAVVLVGDAGKTWDKDYTVLKQSLEQEGWEIRQAEEGQDIPDDASLAIVLGISSMDDFAVYPIDQFLMRGGKVMVAAQGVQIMTDYGFYAQPVAEDNAMLTALKAWGVGIDRELVMDANAVNLLFQTRTESGGMGYNLVAYPHWIRMTEDNFSKDSPITSRLAELQLMWSSPLRVSAATGVEVQILAKSSKKAWRSTRNFPVSPDEQYRWAEERSQTQGQYDLAASFTGPMPGAFAGKEPPVREGAPSPWKDKPLSAAEGDARLVVVSSGDFASDLMKNTQSYANAGFVAMAAEWLSADEDLLAIRPMNLQDTKLSKVTDEKTRSTLIVLFYIIVLGLVPAGVVAYGLIRIIRRRRRAESGKAVSDLAADKEGGK